MNTIEITRLINNRMITEKKPGGKEKIKKLLQKNSGHLKALFAYSVLTLIMTYPVFLNMRTEIPIWQSDTYQVIGQVQNQLNVFEDKGFFKGIAYLAKRHQINIFFLYAVPSFFIGKFLAYNLIFLLSFLLSAFSAYLLAFYFTRSRLASFPAGLIYAFAPFHFYQSLSTHVGTMHQEWLALFALFLFKFFEEFRFKYFLATAFLFLIIAVTEHQLLAFTAIFVGIFAIFRILTKPRLLLNKRFILYSLASVAFLAFVAFALFGPLLKIAISEENYLDAGSGQAKRYAISPADPIVPAASNSLRPDLHQKILDRIQSKTKLDLGKVGEKMSSSFLSYTGLALTVLALFSLFFRRKAEPDDAPWTGKKAVLFWLLTIIAFYFLSLGPSIKFDGREIAMPFNFVAAQLPFYENIRTTGRFFVYSLLGASVLASFGFAFLTRRIKPAKLILSAILGLAILLEFATIPIPTTSLAYSPFYDRIAKEPGKFKLLEIPGSTSYDYASFQMVTNGVHRKPVINGMAFAREIEGQFDFQKNTPVIRQLLFNLPDGDDADFSDTSSGIIKRNYLDVATDILNYYGIRYVTVQKEFVDEEERINIDDFMKRHLALAEIYEDANLVAYKVEQRAPQAFYTTIMDREGKWSDRIKSVKDKLNYRRAASGAEIQLENMADSPKDMSASFRAKAGASKAISFSDKGGQELASFEISKDWQTYQFDFRIDSGTNILILRQFSRNGDEIESQDKDQLVSVSNIVFSEK